MPARTLKMPEELSILSNKTKVVIFDVDGTLYYQPKLRKRCSALYWLITRYGRGACKRC